MKKDLETLEIQLPPEVAAELRYIVDRPCSWEGATFVRTSTEGLHVSGETMSKILANCTVKLRLKRTKGTLSNEGV